VTELKNGVTPYFCKYHADFIRNFIKELKEADFVVKNYYSKCVSPALAVKKPGGGGYRIVIDLRDVNGRSILTVWPIPFQGEMVHRLGGSKFWFKLELFKGLRKFFLY
jgi:hypothetical protein